MRISPNNRLFVAQTASSFVALLFAVGAGEGQEKSSWSFEKTKSGFVIQARGKPFAQYRHEDPKIARPFFCFLHAPDGRQVSRNHPPVPGKDATDHDTFHPGLWLSFGDLSGEDFWRIKAKVELEKILEEPKTAGKEATFVVRHKLMGKAGVIGWETDAFRFMDVPDGYLLVWQASFEPAGDQLVFGDQEEMGLGFRLETALTVKAGGTIRDSEKRSNEKGVWGKQAASCAYYRSFAEAGKSPQHVGIALFPDPKNFRPSWWHARDYGLLVANPFGRNAFTRGEKSKITVKKGEPFTLTFGVFIFSQAGDVPVIDDAYKEFLRLAPVRRTGAGVSMDG